MFSRLFNSIVSHLGALLMIISCVSIISMFSSVYISELADKDALAINHAGSMRMQSYRILSDVALAKYQITNDSNQVNKLQQSISLFTEKLNAPVLNHPQIMADNPTLAGMYSDISKEWQQQLKPTLNSLIKSPEKISSEQLMLLEKDIEKFVIKIDAMVLFYQQHAESRITLIRMIQGIALFLTVILVALTLLQLIRKVERPLSELTRAAKQIMAGDYTAETHISQNDELGLLSTTMNKMSKSISQSHGQLEKRVREKTTELTQSNDSLQLLYQIAQLINHSDDSLDIEPIVQKLATVTNIKDLDLCLMTSKGNAPYEHIITSEKQLPEHCIEGDCNSCITQKVKCDTDTKTTQIKYPLVKEKVNFGVLVCNLPSNSNLASWQHQLFSSVADQIAMALSLRQQQEQTRRLSLLTERNTIARELHDSLAQALSYLKFQVTRLQKLRKKDNNEAQIDEVVLELKGGLSAAYRELRELLTTFRLKIDSEGLEQTFIQTVQQLNERASGNMEFKLNYNIGAIPLTPNEEIHLMQIAREATQNALHHSKGNLSTLSAFSDESKRVHLIIEDNGVGMPDDPNKLNHYGLAIMQERSNHLNGGISIKNGTNGGTRVELVFTPNYLQTISDTSLFTKVS